MVPTINALEIERDEVVARIKNADAAMSPIGDLDIDLWDVMPLDEQREIVTRAFSSIVVLRRYQDQADDTERIISTFRETFNPAMTSPVKGYAVPTVKTPGGWKLA